MAMDADSNNTGHKAKGRARGAAEPVAPDPVTLDPRAVARDWIDLWQSELSAMNADPAVREGWQAVASLWAGAMTTMLRTAPRAAAPAEHDGSAGGAGAADAAGAASAVVAPDARDAEIARLSRHVATLESRVAELERSGATGAVAKRPKRKT